MPTIAPTRREDQASCAVEMLVRAYRTTAEGDAGLALRYAVTDPLADLEESKKRSQERSRLISRGFVRGCV